MKVQILAILTMALALSVHNPVSAGPTGELAERYFSKKNPRLTAQEKAAIAIGKRWSAGDSTGMNPVTGPNGEIRYVFGAQQPSIVCAVLQVCDVALQAGERVNSIHLGDTARWTVEPAITGRASTETQHLMIKPMDVGLETSLVVTTNRRTYHFKLRSHRRKYMPQVAFIYPEDALAKWDTMQTRVQQAYQQKALPESGEYLDDLFFDYELDGDVAWKPVRVFNDGRKTILQMPDDMNKTEAPTLLIVRKQGGLFSDDETVMVNYRVQGNRYIVDSVFDQAILIAGVGSNQDRVTITRNK